MKQIIAAVMLFTVVGCGGSEDAVILVATPQTPEGPRGPGYEEPPDTSAEFQEGYLPDEIPPAVIPDSTVADAGTPDAGPLPPQCNNPSKGKGHAYGVAKKCD